MAGKTYEVEQGPFQPYVLTLFLTQLDLNAVRDSESIHAAIDEFEDFSVLGFANRDGIRAFKEVGGSFESVFQEWDPFRFLGDLVYILAPPLRNFISRNHLGVQRVFWGEGDGANTPLFVTPS